MTYYFEGKTQEEINEFMSQERWVDIKGYEGLYQVSNWGNVKSLERDIIYKNGKKRTVSERLLSPLKNMNGYLFVVLVKNGIKKNLRVQRLVLCSFLNDSLTTELHVNHLNEIRTDNRLDNLSLCTQKENNNWGTRNKKLSDSLKGGTRSQESKYRMAKAQQQSNGKPINQYDLNGNFIRRWDYISQVGKFYKNTAMFANIWQCCKGNKKQAYGYKWEYAS